MKIFRLLPLAVVAIAGCAEHSVSISPFFVPASQYAGYSCLQLRLEAKRVEEDLEGFTTVQDRLATRDTMLAAAVLVPVTSPAV